MDLFEGLIRDRPVVKRVKERLLERNDDLVNRVVRERSPMFRNYVKGISKTTGLDEDEVLQSEPAQEYLGKLTGLGD